MDFDYALHHFWWHTRTGKWLRVAGDYLAIVGFLLLIAVLIGKCVLNQLAL